MSHEWTDYCPYHIDDILFYDSIDCYILANLDLISSNQTNKSYINEVT